MNNILWENIDELAKRNIAGLVYNSEFNFTYQINRLADDIYKNFDIKILLVAGPSASGKTTFSKLLKDRLEFFGIKTYAIALDDYFINRDNLPTLPNGLRDLDSIRALDLIKLRNDLRSVFKGRKVSIPKYNFLSGKRVKSTQSVEMLHHDILIIEGIHAHNPKLIEDENILRYCKKVFISPERSFVFDNNESLHPNELRLMRRLLRDFYTRGHSLQNTLNQWQEVLNAEKIYIYPYSTKADYFIDSVYEYELYVYRKFLYDNIKEFKSSLLTNILNILGKISNINLPTIPVESLINEFVSF